VLRYGSDWLVASAAIYFYSGTTASSLRLYRETLTDPAFWAAQLSAVPATIPVALADLAFEMLRTPAWFARSKFGRVVRYTTFREGGHFAAAEVPESLAEDIHVAVGHMQ
jgi:epoxide hydrolase